LIHWSQQLVDLLQNHGAYFALAQVIIIDLVMAGDNAVVIGMAATRLPPDMRHKVIFWGLAAAVIMRVAMAMVTVELFAFIPLRIVGGILLLWVAWRLFRDVRNAHSDGNDGEDGHAIAFADPETGKVAMRRAIIQITIADISMSLDNVLAVAGVAIHHVWVLAIGLVLSIGLMGIAANMVAKMLNKHAWISYAGVFIVLYVALNMIWHGGTLLAAQY